MEHVPDQDLATKQEKQFKAYVAYPSSPGTLQCELLPKILERVLCDVSLDDALAAKPKTAGGEESAEVVRCRVLAFVESLLDL